MLETIIKFMTLLSLGVFIFLQLLDLDCYGNQKKWKLCGIVNGDNWKLSYGIVLIIFGVFLMLSSMV